MNCASAIAAHHNLHNRLSRGSAPPSCGNSGRRWLFQQTHRRAGRSQTRQGLLYDGADRRADGGALTTGVGVGASGLDARARNTDPQRFVIAQYRDEEAAAAGLFGSLESSDDQPASGSTASQLVTGKG